MPNNTYRTVYDTAELADGCRDALEALVDKFGLPRVLDILANVAWEKSVHLNDNWQDRSAAKTWQTASVTIDNCANTVRQRFEKQYGKVS